MIRIGPGASLYVFGFRRSAVVLRIFFFFFLLQVMWIMREKKTKQQFKNHVLSTYIYKCILLGTNPFGLPDTRRRSCCSWYVSRRIQFSGNRRCSWSARTLRATPATKSHPVFSRPSPWWRPRTRRNFSLRKRRTDRRLMSERITCWKSYGVTVKKEIGSPEVCFGFRGGQ